MQYVGECYISYIYIYIVNLSNKNKNAYQLYKYIGRVKNKTPNKIYITDEGLSLEEEVDIANQFNKFFTQKVDDWAASPIPEFQFSESEESQNVQSPVLQTIELFPEEVLKELLHLKTTKSSGFSFINNKLLKYYGFIIYYPIYWLFVAIVRIKQIPKVFKLGCITPILKSGKPNKFFSSYRAISITPILNRIFEGILLKQMRMYHYEHNTIPNTQYGFKRNSSCERQLIDLIDYVAMAFNDKDTIFVDIVFLDYSSAFDTVSHCKLLQDLYDLGYRGDFF